MRKIHLNEWASISEIVASMGVIISLLVLAYSVRENTVQTQATNDNFLYELQYARIRAVSENTDIAVLYTKLKNGEALTDIEETQLQWDNLQQIGTWEIAFVRHNDGVYSDERWTAWDMYYRAALLETFSKEQWSEVRHWYEEEFRNYIDSVYAE